jgi:hypothetical protein
LRAVQQRIRALTCPRRRGEMRLIAFLTEPASIRAILTHLGEPTTPPVLAPRARTPPELEAEGAAQPRSRLSTALERRASSLDAQQQCRNLRCHDRSADFPPTSTSAALTHRAGKKGLWNSYP